MPNTEKKPAPQANENKKPEAETKKPELAQKDKDKAVENTKKA